jgi:hypothetical protein
MYLFLSTFEVLNRYFGTAIRVKITCSINGDLASGESMRYRNCVGLVGLEGMNQMC